MTKEELIKIIKHPDFSIRLRGGNDEGGVEIGGNNLSCQIQDAFNLTCCEASNYGSFAGNFTVDCTGNYDEECEAIIFDGTDLSEEDYAVEKYIEISVEIPESIINTIDCIRYSVDLSYDEFHNVQCDVVIKNDIWTDEHEELENQIIDLLKEENYLEHCWVDSVVILEPFTDIIEFSFVTGSYEETDVSFEVPIENILDQINNYE